LEAFPAKPRVVQNGLFVPLAPEPEKLELTLARLKAVVGEENVGAAEILDTHRPDGIAVRKFGVPLPSWYRRGGAQRRGGQSRIDMNYERPPRPSGTPPVPGGEWRSTQLGLRLLRPALEATVQLRNDIPIWIAFHGVHGPIKTASGPWRTSGDWWRPNTWDREEWDIELRDALYRIYFDVHLDRWYAQGVYD
jgi:protein ImuB